MCSTLSRTFRSVRPDTFSDLLAVLLGVSDCTSNLMDTLSVAVFLAASNLTGLTDVFQIGLFDAILTSVDAAWVKTAFVNTAVVDADFIDEDGEIDTALAWSTECEQDR